MHSCTFKLHKKLSSNLKGPLSNQEPNWSNAHASDWRLSHPQTDLIVNKRFQNLSVLEVQPSYKRFVNCSVDTHETNCTSAVQFAVRLILRSNKLPTNLVNIHKWNLQSAVTLFCADGRFLTASFWSQLYFDRFLKVIKTI